MAVFAGNRFFRLQPMPAPGGESTHQQILPISALGHEYVAAPYETRRKDLQPEEISYRIVGSFEGTVLTYDPAVPGAPGSVGQGQAGLGNVQVRWSGLTSSRFRTWETSSEIRTPPNQRLGVKPRHLKLRSPEGRKFQLHTSS